MDEQPVAVPVAQAEKKYQLGAVAGGELPDLGALFNETLAEFMDHLGPYVLAALGQFLVAVPVGIAMVVVLYVLMIFGMFGVMLGGFGLGAVLMQLSEGLGAIVMLLGYVASIFSPLASMVPVLVLTVVLLAPFNASLVRAVAAHQRGEKVLDLSAAFSTVTQDLVSVVLVALAVGTLVGVGLMLCFLPAMAVPLVIGFASSMTALHHVGAVRSLRDNVGHVLAHPTWHLTFGLVYIALSMVAGYLPLIGSMFVVALHVRAYRRVFGDGDTPVLTVG
ncbi:MAG: hypothetical protein R3F59_00400 [Myxococcota bacterium]